MTVDLQITKLDRRLLEVCCQAIDETKGEDIVILDVSKQSSITNFLILASANSEPHMRALKRDLDKTLKDHNVSVLGADEGDERLEERPEGVSAVVQDGAQEGWLQAAGGGQPSLCAQGAEEFRGRARG